MFGYAALLVCVTISLAFTCTGSSPTNTRRRLPGLPETPDIGTDGTIYNEKYDGDDGQDASVLKTIDGGKVLCITYVNGEYKFPLEPIAEADFNPVEFDSSDKAKEETNPNWFIGMCGAGGNAAGQMELVKNEYVSRMEKSSSKYETHLIHAYGSRFTKEDHIPFQGFNLLIYWIVQYIKMAGATKEDCKLFLYLDVHGTEASDIFCCEKRMETEQMRKADFWELVQCIPYGQVLVYSTACYGIGGFGETLFPHMSQVEINGQTEELSRMEYGYWWQDNTWEGKKLKHRNGRKPGDSGIVVDAVGTILNVKKYSPAWFQNVRKGWRIVKINKMNFHNGDYINDGCRETVQEHLNILKGSKRNFTITYDTTRTENHFEGLSSIPYSVTIHGSGKRMCVMKFDYEEQTMVVGRGDRRTEKGTNCIKTVHSSKVVRNWIPTKAKNGFSCRILVVAASGIDTQGWCYNKTRNQEFFLNAMNLKISSMMLATATGTEHACVKPHVYCNVKPDEQLNTSNIWEWVVGV